MRKHSAAHSSFRRPQTRGDSQKEKRESLHDLPCSVNLLYECSKLTGTSMNYLQLLNFEFDVCLLKDRKKMPVCIFDKKESSVAPASQHV